MNIEQIMIQLLVLDINGRDKYILEFLIFINLLCRSLKALWTYLKKRDIDVAEIMERIKDLIIKTIIRFKRR